ncbi:MAG: (2Fe-2S)-binding protein [Myxococcales bacterium]|nr:(2Fe-2S)-binding protein [Myxococcales bacterium]MCB9731408.1 (2Fe-2S)-binding protein [Deltaproteobacteria bacterium]
MIVCVCEGVSDRVVRAHIQRGSDSVEALGQSCRAGTDCGRCRDMLRTLVAERALQRASTAPLKLPEPEAT